MRRKGMLSAVLALPFLCVAQSAAPEPQATPYCATNIYLDEADFTEANVTSRCRELLKGQQASFISVWFFTSQDTATNFLNGKLSDHVSYAIWRSAYERLKDTRPIARLISIGDSAILLFRDANDGVSRHVLSGHDPLEVGIGGGKAIHLVDLVLTARIYQSKEYRINVYARTPDELTEGLGLRVISALKSRLPFPEISLNVRNDPWFIDNGFFPAFPPFDPEFPPLDRAQYVVSPTLVCGASVAIERYSCSVFRNHY